MGFLVFVCFGGIGLGIGGIHNEGHLWPTNIQTSATSASRCLFRRATHNNVAHRGGEKVAGLTLKFIRTRPAIYDVYKGFESTERSGMRESQARARASPRGDYRGLNAQGA